MEGLQTIKFIKDNDNWKDILVQPPYSLIIKEDLYFYLLKYNQLESDFSNEIVKECRGLIIDKYSLEPVALSFKKFWEVENELADDIDWSSAKVQEKLDGTKLLCFYNKYEKTWQVASSGNLNIDKINVNDFGMTFGDLFGKALANSLYTRSGFFSSLISSYCYTLELVSPENRVVVPYKKADVYLIGVRKVDTFEEISPNKYQEDFGFLLRTPKEYPLRTLNDCLKATEIMGYDKEGYVVVDKNWHRIKIKSPAWKEVSKIRGDGTLSQRKIITIIDNNLEIEALRFYPEWKEYIDKVRDKIEKYQYVLYLHLSDVREYIETKKLIWQKREDMKKIAAYIETFPFYKSVIYKFVKSFYAGICKFIDDDWSKTSINKKIEILEGIK